MRIGYPCINRSVGCTTNRTFRLKNYSDRRLVETLAGNLACLEKVLAYNDDHGLLFFRISSDIVPFASHPVCTYDWQTAFNDDFRRIGRFAAARGMRFSMHPDQFTLLNSPNEEVLARSIRELAYHCDVLDLLGAGPDARIQIHVGGVYGDKPAAMARFIRRCENLDERLRGRLSVEGDDRLYTFADCARIHEQTGIPVIFDNLHHAVNCSGESTDDVFAALEAMWGGDRGPPMTDYSDQAQGGTAGKHAEHIDADAFKHYLAATGGRDFDIMLEIKDKEHSAVEALVIAGSAREDGTNAPGD